MAFVKSSMLAGRTDSNQSLLKTIELSKAFTSGERSVVLISNANPTLKTASARRISQNFNHANNSDSLPNIRLLAMASGSDANRTLLEELTRKCRGSFAAARETEEITTQLKILFLRIGRPSIDGLQFSPPTRRTSRTSTR